jgi:hypothetical protein
MNSDDSPVVPSPWRVRRSFPHPVVTNASDEPLALARALIRVGDEVHIEQWGLILPHDQNEICLCGLETSDLLWQFVF